MPERKIIENAKEVLRIEGESVLNLIDQIDDQFAKAVETIKKSAGRCIFTGMGKSGLIARKIVATFNSTGTPAFYLHPTDALHGDLGMVRKEDIVILLSKSGSTEELLSLVPMIKRIGALIIGFLGNGESQIGIDCDYIIDVSVKEEACPHDLAPTASTTAALAMGDALAVALLKDRGFTAEDFAQLHPGGSLGKRLSLRISEIMYTGKFLPTVYENTSIRDSIIEITSKRFGTTAVIDKEGYLKGIITDGDLRRLLEKTLDIENLTAKDIMTAKPKTISQEYLASFALQQMESYNITSLIVTSPDNKPIGIIHLHDLVKLGLQRR